MFQATQALPHLLEPSDYTSLDSWERERKGVLQSAWHLVGLVKQLEQPGSFLTTELLGHPIHVRNFNGQLKALSNVCAHRHCLISSLPQGQSKSMQCQYHGWEYGEDGLTRKIPSAKDFAPIDREKLCLPSYHLDQCGGLVFVNLSNDPIPLREFLEPMTSTIDSRFNGDWHKNYDRQFEYQANWKVAIENSLEAYHVEAIHPSTFKSAPGEARSEHQLNPRHTSFVTDMPFAAHSRVDRWFQKSEATIVRMLGGSVQREYQQHHLFPNLLFSFTDAISLVHSVTPISHDRSRSRIIQFGYVPEKKTILHRTLGRGWGKIEAMVLNQIMSEDLAIYPAIHRGLESSPHTGTLGRCEERIHAFQNFLKSQ